jgi:hypothetical protein
MSFSAKKGRRPPRWATRQEAMTYARIGSSKMNQWLHSGRIFAKKLDSKVIVDLNSVDDLIASAPDVADKVVA